MKINTIKEHRKNFMKPERNPNISYDELMINLLPESCLDFTERMQRGFTMKDSAAKMYSKDKNLWITGTKEQLENFIKNTIGDDLVHVFDKDKYRWNEYFGQPFIITRLYDRKKRQEKLSRLRALGDWLQRPIEKSCYCLLHPDLFHCIVLSIYTMEEYCKDYPQEVGGLKWRYDELKL